MSMRNGLVVIVLSLIVRTVTAAPVDSLKHKPVTIDERLFWSINHTADTSAGVDAVMLMASNSLLPLAIAAPISMITYGIVKHDATAAYDGVAIGAATATTILFQELVIKPIVRRDRPFRTLEGTRWIDSNAHGFSFPSSHASISFGLATALSLRYPKWYVIAPSMLYALVVTLSRPYLGVHYPGDILAGAVIGSLIQFAAFRLERSYPTPGLINKIAGSEAGISFSVPLH